MIILDNALPENIFEKVEDLILNQIEWFYMEGTAYAVKSENTSIFDYSFYHLVWDEFRSKSEAANLLMPVIGKLFESANQKVKSIIRVRIGLIPNVGKNFVHGGHVDYKTPHKTALFYVNDSDGDTLFYNQIYKPGDGEPSKSFKSKKVIKRVTPRANRFVCFDGFQFHSSSSPVKHSRRVVFNINYHPF